MSITVVTTCSKKGWEIYGRNFYWTFKEYWSSDINLLFYSEDELSIDTLAFPQWFVDWKEKHKDNRDAHGRDRKRNRRGVEYDFRRDAVRFGHKVAAITDAAFRVKSGLLIWIDADVVTHAPVNEEWLKRLLPDASLLSWLERTGTYPECGFLVFDVGSKAFTPFMDLLRNTYQRDVVFKLKETHDSYVIQYLVLQVEKQGYIKHPYNLSGKHSNKSHPFPASVLGERLDHAKGRYKLTGRTPKNAVNRSEDYWR